MRHFMRKFVGTVIAATLLLAIAGESQAQVRLFSRNYAVTPAPYYYGPTMFGSAGYASPYGYQSYSSYSVAPGYIYPGYYGPVAYSSSGTSIRPYVAGPFHSVYWDPYSNTYRYTGGYLNTPNYYYHSGYPY